MPTPMTTPEAHEIATALESGSPKKQGMAALNLGALGVEAGPLIPLLIRTMERVDADCTTLDKRTTSVVTIGLCTLRQYLQASRNLPTHDATTAEAAWSTLVRLAEARNVDIAHHAVSELGWLGDPRCLPTLCRIMTLDSPDSEVTLPARAFQAMLRIEPDRAASPEFQRARNDYAQACLRIIIA